MVNAVDDAQKPSAQFCDVSVELLQTFTFSVSALSASLQGPLANPDLSGNATILNGRLRHFALPHSLDAINGR